MPTALSVLVSGAEGKLEMEKAPSGRALLTCWRSGWRERFLGGMGEGREREGRVGKESRGGGGESFLPCDPVRNREENLRGFHFGWDSSLET